MFTDGVAEAFNADFEEFGEERIVDLVRAQADGHGRGARRRRPAPSGGGAQSDDFTVVIARGREVGA